MIELKQKLGGKQPLRMSWHTLPDLTVISTIANSNFDVCALDMQHGLHMDSDIPAGIATVVAAGKSPLVRVPVGRWDMVERALDFGAHGVIAPMINSVEEARAFASSAKYPPLGGRSYGPIRAADLSKLDAAQYVSTANETTLALAMIETEQAFDNLDAILEVEGIDGILMGPGDFSISFRQNPVPNAYGPDTVDQVRIVAEKTRAAGKIPTAFAMIADHYKLVAEMGYQIVSISTDLTFVRSGIKAETVGIDGTSQ